jgi:F-type H+-transporting ATPase subunit epsilon
MPTFPFELVSPERLLISEPADEVRVPGTEGEFTVLPGHAPIISSLRPGIVTVIAGGTTRRLFVRSGLAENTPERGLTILAEEALPAEELDAAKLDQEIQDATENLADATGPETKRRAQEMLDRLRELKAAIASGQVATH